MKTLDLINKTSDKLGRIIKGKTIRYRIRTYNANPGADEIQTLSDIDHILQVIYKM